MKTTLRILILAALCFGLCACNETENPENTADTEILDSGAAVQSESTADSSTKLPESTADSSAELPESTAVSSAELPESTAVPSTELPESTAETTIFTNPNAHLSFHPFLTPQEILSAGQLSWSFVNCHHTIPDTNCCDPSTIKETVYSIMPETYNDMAKGGDMISILYPMIDIPSAPELAEQLNQEIHDFMFDYVAFPECSLGYMHVTGTYAITWADRTHFSIVCFRNFNYNRVTDSWYGITVDVTAKKKMTLADLSMTNEKFDALLTYPDTRYSLYLGYAEDRELLKTWLPDNLNPETNSNFFIASAPYNPYASQSSFATPASLYTVLLWPYCMGGGKDALIKVPFSFDESAESDAAPATAETTAANTSGI